jgi:hypothetical protein
VRFFGRSRTGPTLAPSFAGVVRVVEGASGSHVEPPFDRSWSLLDQLRWKAAVVAYGTDVSVSVASVVAPAGCRFDGYFNVCTTAPNRSRFVGPVNFDVAWGFLTGLSDGIGVVRR